MKNIIWYSFLLFTLIFTACMSDASYTPSIASKEGSYNTPVGYIAEEALEMDMAYKTQTVSNKKGDANRITEETKIKPKIIRDATVSLQVENYKESRKAIDVAISTAEAYITLEDESKSGYSWKNNLVIRVSSQKFDVLLEALEKTAIYTDHKRINAKDVTAEFIDIEARLNNRKQVEKRFQEILQQAKSIKEILEVENEIRKIREEIDASEGRLKYLRDQVSFSTINLTYYEKLDYEAAPERSYFTKITRAIGEGWEGFLEFTIAVMYAWPFWIGLGIVTWFLRRWWGNRKQ
ncbi:MAG: DUF4349 domain-containing protein [Chitinophagales bacterium]